MMRFERPPMPAEFKPAKKAAKKNKLHLAHDAVAKAIKRKQKPEFPEHWKDFKGQFSVAQHGKCGYCDLQAAAGQPGDVEHFAPKSEVWILGDDPATWGRETTDGLSNIRGRVKADLLPTGYWWLAYQWTNYLFACTVCNSRWKLSYFPVKPSGKRRLAPKSGRKEGILLLNCFDDGMPWQHFRFDRLGQIEKLTVRGFETIRTCGLDRETLRAARQPYVEDARLECELLLKRPDDVEALRRLVRMGEPRRSFASAVRAVAWELLGVPWDKLEAKAV